MNNRNAMNKKILSLIILFLGVFSVMQAQNDGKIRVKGVVLDETTRQPIAFANIGIIGTAAGAASDMDGLFELIVSEKLATYMMRVSAVGYASAEMKVYEARDKGGGSNSSETGNLRDRRGGRDGRVAGIEKTTGKRGEEYREKLYSPSL